MQVIHDEDDLRFYIRFGDEEAELTYTYPEDGVLDLDYVFVPESYRGQGIADKLVQASMDFVESRGYQFIASCPVVEAFIKRHPKYKSMMKEV